MNLDEPKLSPATLDDALPASRKRPFAMELVFIARALNYIGSVLLSICFLLMTAVAIANHDRDPDAPSGFARAAIVVMASSFVASLFGVAAITVRKLSVARQFVAASLFCSSGLCSVVAFSSWRSGSGIGHVAITLAFTSTIAALSAALPMSWAESGRSNG